MLTRSAWNGLGNLLCRVMVLWRFSGRPWRQWNTRRRRRDVMRPRAMWRLERGISSSASCFGEWPIRNVALHNRTL